MFKRIDFDKIGGFNVNMKIGLEDWDFWISLLENDGRVKYLDDFHFLYRIKKKNVSRNAQLTCEKARLLRHQLWENHKESYTKYYPDPYEYFEYQLVANSKEYRLGKIILKPLRKLLNK